MRLAGLRQAEAEHLAKVSIDAVSGALQDRTFTLPVVRSSKDERWHNALEEVIMRMFDVQGIEIHAPPTTVFDFVRNPANLPRWARAFLAAGDGRARLETPEGAVEIRLYTLADARAGTVDWRLEFPDGGVGLAHSRVTGTTRGTCIYSFVLHAPPVALEQIEGALEAQRVTLRSELATLKSLMETS